MSSVYWASDYAGIKTDHVKLYYGYEETLPITPKEDEDSDWCFVARFKDKSKEEIRIPFSKLSRLGAEDQWNCQDCLCHGIAYMLKKGLLK